jgi:hypothetical protein
MITPVTHLLPLTHVRRDRMLPVKGHVLVGSGAHVNANDVVAEAYQPGQHIILDIRRMLNIRRIEDAHQQIRYKPGEKVEKGDILAQVNGLIPRVVRAPAEGKVKGIYRGQIILETPGSKIELIAGISGNVTEILPDRGLVIEADGALLQGVWGNGKTGVGMLVISATPLEDELTRATLDVSLRSAVVLAGHVAQADTLVAAGELPVRGLVLASMTADLIETAKKMDYPIILMEGFGRLPLNAAAVNLLTTNQKRDIILNGLWDAERNEKPDLFIPLPAQGVQAPEYAEFETGKTVRVTVPPFAGQAATLIHVRPGLTAFANGLRVSAADVQLETNLIVTVPLANLNVLE